VTQGDWPEWAPLFDGVREELEAKFMWMYEVELDNRSLLQVYKHIDTRRSMHLAADGAAFVYEHPSRYRPIELAELLPVVLAPPGPCQRCGKLVRFPARLIC
jgi:hypothetical protein